MMLLMMPMPLMPLMPRLIVFTLSTLTACARGQPTAAPEAKPGDAFVVTRDTPFYDSGCAQARANDGKLKKGTRFTLVGVDGSCWNVKLGDEDEVYIQPGSVAPAR